MNFKRRQFLSLVIDALEGRVSSIVVAHKEALPLPSTFDYHSRVERNQVYSLIDKNQSALTCHE